MKQPLTAAFTAALAVTLMSAGASTGAAEQKPVEDYAKVPMPAGSYLTGPGLMVPGSDRPKRRPLGHGRHAVEISVAGAGALSGGGKVDVLVTTDNDRGGGRTLVAARRVPLISIGRTGQSEAGPGLTEVTLGLTRGEAIRLVDAQTFARRITVLPPAGP